MTKLILQGKQTYLERRFKCLLHLIIDNMIIYIQYNKPFRISDLLDDSYQNSILSVYMR